MLRAMALGAGAALVLAVGADAATVKVGIGMGGGTHNFIETNSLVPTATTLSAQSHGIWQTQAYLGTESLSQVAGGLMTPSDALAIGLEAGVGLPLGGHTFDETMRYVPPAGTAHPDEGDTTTYKLTSVPLLVKALYVNPMGSINASLGLGLGATLVAWQVETLDILWDNPATANVTYTSNKGGAGWVETGRSLAYGASTVAVFTMRITPGASFALSGSDSIGAEVPISWNSTTIGMGNETTYKTSLSGIANPQTSTVSSGGIEFGLNLVWTRRFGGGAAPAKK
ncbi:MAG: hypothetical protein AAB368_09200 [bacterium]